MLFWLAEALAIDDAQLDAALASVTRIDSKGARQCAGLREHITWLDIEAGLESYNYIFFKKLRIKAANQISLVDKMGDDGTARHPKYMILKE